jgi:hypothetical protein
LLVSWGVGSHAEKGIAKMEATLRAILDFLRSKGAESGDTFQISFFFQMTDGVEIRGTDVIAALDLAVRRGFVRPVRALVRTYRLTDAGFDAMHEASLTFNVASNIAVTSHGESLGGEH